MTGKTPSPGITTNPGYNSGMQFSVRPPLGRSTSPPVRCWRAPSPVDTLGIPAASRGMGASFQTIRANELAYATANPPNPQAPCNTRSRMATRRRSVAPGSRPGHSRARATPCTDHAVSPPQILYRRPGNRSDFPDETRHRRPGLHRNTEAGHRAIRRLEGNHRIPRRIPGRTRCRGRTGTGASRKPRAEWGILGKRPGHSLLGRRGARQLSASAGTQRRHTRVRPQTRHAERTRQRHAAASSRHADRGVDAIPQRRLRTTDAPTACRRFIPTCRSRRGRNPSATPTND